MKRKPRLLFVCSGNLHRSVMAAAIARAMLSQATGQPDPARIASAGTLGLQNRASPPEVIAVCGELGLDVSSHRSQGITRSLVEHSDRIIVMENKHWEHVLRLSPEAEPRLTHLGDYQETPGDVHDPIGQPLETFRQSRNNILKALQNLLPELLLLF